jgi:hypothetical protein
MTLKVHEKSRVNIPGMPGDECNGLFAVRLKSGELCKVIASNGLGWEHVSVSLETRCPTWDEMCEIKDLFWDSEDCVVQFHPSKIDYVNLHLNCLHLWRPIGIDLPMPNKIMI